MPPGLTPSPKPMSTPTQQRTAVGQGRGAKERGSLFLIDNITNGDGRFKVLRQLDAICHLGEDGVVTKLRLPKCVSRSWDKRRQVVVTEDGLWTFTCHNRGCRNGGGERELCMGHGLTKMRGIGGWVTGRNYPVSRPKHGAFGS